MDGAGIGVRLRAARERLGWSREQLAVQSGVSWSAIAQVESGRRTNVRPATLSGLARALGVTIDYLVEGGASSSTMLEHRALVYDTDEQFTATAGVFLAEGIERSEAAVAVTTRTNIALLRRHLGRDAGRIDFFDSGGWYDTPSSALEAYDTLLKAKLEAGALWVRVVGEPVWAQRSEPEIRLWARYESLLNLVFGGSPMTVLCPYDERSVRPGIVKQACVTHPATIGKQGLAASPEYVDPGRFALE